MSMAAHMSRDGYIQQVLARAGHGSRREIEAWLRAGRLRVNGKTAEPGSRITLRDRVTLDDKPLGVAQERATRVLAMHKPEGVICTRRDPQGRPTVFDKLPDRKRERWVNIGRLDINTSGLLLFTNDGDLAQRMTHPSAQVEREYAVRVLGEVSDAMLENMLRGVRLDGKCSRFTDIVRVEGKKRSANQWFYVVLMSGRNREVRRLWESQRVKVSRLIRVRYGDYVLPKGKKKGACWELERKEWQGWL